MYIIKDISTGDAFNEDRDELIGKVFNGSFYKWGSSGYGRADFTCTVHCKIKGERDLLEGDPINFHMIKVEEVD